MGKHQLQRYMFEVISAMQQHGAVIYGFGRNGRKCKAFCDDVGVEIRGIYDNNAERYIKSGGVRRPDDIPKSGDHDAVCIISPAKGREEILPLVEPYYQRIIGSEELHWLLHALPEDGGQEDFSYSWARPFNFYESPFIAPDEYAFVRRMEEADAAPVREIAWNLDGQKAFLRHLDRMLPEFRADLETFSRFRENGMFGFSDALTLYGMLRMQMPKRIIEIGSGFSTKLSMDTSERWNGGRTEITCIEPYPDRLLTGLREHPYPRMKLVQAMVQEADLHVFDALEAGDILFIDSPHVVKHGGDVPFELFEILPRLASGVRIHFHDMFYPFTYPKTWIQHGLPYTEAYALRAFLSYNNAYGMLYFSDMMAKQEDEEARDFFAKVGTDRGSLWIRKK